MITRLNWIGFVFLLLLLAIPSFSWSTNGITPEQIYQPTIDWQNIVGTWEVLPEETPLAERDNPTTKPSSRILVTLRKDGTCRMFGPDHPTGADGLWTFEDHELYLKMHGQKDVGYYVYGIKADFMITRSPVVGGKDQLWSRIK
jgi:hypothetical protein